MLATELRLNDVVILGNLQLYKTASVDEAIEPVVARLLYLPPYSPDVNPIETTMWPKVKTHLRSAARTFDDLCDAVAAALKAIVGHDRKGFFQDCGYAAGHLNAL